MIRHWSVLCPLAMSAAALALVLAHVASGGGRQADEGAAAHLWQLLIAAQLPVVVLFAATWLPRRPGQAFLVMAIQAAGLIANFALVRSLSL